MKYRASLSDYAKEDKTEIKNYLSKFYPSTPNQFIAELKKNIENVKDNPYMYPVYSENPEYRRMIIGNYIALFKVIEEEKRVDIHRILRASWNIPAYI